MNYCENCYCVTDFERCPMCGGKKLRQAKEDDFCFLLEKDTAYCDVLASILQEKDIRFSAVPCGSGVRSAFGLSLENRRVYVPFGSLSAAREAVEERENFESETLRETLLENADSFNISLKLKRKLEKKFGFSGDKELFDYCVNVIRSARKIVDAGKMTASDGHWLFCYSDNTVLAVNSLTYEIMSLDITENNR